MAEGKTLVATGHVLNTLLVDSPADQYWETGW